MTELPKNREILVRSGDFIRRNTLNSQPIQQNHLTNEDAGKLFAEIALESDLENFVVNNDNIKQRKIVPPSH